MFTPSLPSAGIMCQFLIRIGTGHIICEYKIVKTCSTIIKMNGIFIHMTQLSNYKLNTENLVLMTSEARIFYMINDLFP